jgi:hypothetical protein
LHVCQPGRQALVYDLMEPYRPQVDQEVLAIVRSQVFTPRDFVIDSHGVCRMHPEFAKRLTGSCTASIGLKPQLVDFRTAVGGRPGQE